jgi:hypothetical protein
MTIKELKAIIQDMTDNIEVIYFGAQSRGYKLNRKENILITDRYTIHKNTRNVTYYVISDYAPKQEKPIIAIVN